MTVNTFRTFADKHQSMELYLAAAINKVENLSMDVKMYDMEKQCNELYFKTYVVNAEAKGDIVSGVEEQKQDYHANVVINSRGR